MSGGKLASLRRVFMAQEVDMTEGKPMGLLLRFALPLLLGNCLQQLYNIVDSLVVGRYLGPGALAAVGTTFPIIFLFASLFIGIAIGATVIISQYYGAKDYVKLQLTIDTIYKGFIVGGLLLTLLGSALLHPTLRLLNVPPETHVMSAAYLQVVFLGFLPNFGYNVNAGILQGMGDTVSPVIYLAVATVLNIVLDIFFVGGLAMGVRGAALATIIAQTVSFAFGLWHINKKSSLIRVSVFNRRFSLPILRDCVRLGLPAGLQNMFFSLGMLAMQRLINGFGTSFMAGFSAANKIDSFAFMPMMSYGNAITSFTGQNMGAGKYHRIEQGVRQALLLTLLTSAVLVPLVLLTGPQLLSLFLEKPDPVVIEAGLAYLNRVLPFMAMIGIMLIYNGALRGIGKSFIPFLSSLASLWLARVPVAYYIAAHFGRENIYYSYAVGWIPGIAICAGYYYWGRWRKKYLA